MVKFTVFLLIQTLIKRQHQDKSHAFGGWCRGAVDELDEPLREELLLQFPPAGAQFIAHVQHDFIIMNHVVEQVYSCHARFEFLQDCTAQILVNAGVGSSDEFGVFRLRGMGELGFKVVVYGAVLFAVDFIFLLQVFETGLSVVISRDDDTVIGRDYDQSADTRTTSDRLL